MKPEPVEPVEKAQMKHHNRKGQLPFSDQRTWPEEAAVLFYAYEAF